MRTLGRKIVGLLQDTSGQDIAEAAMVLPLMFMILIGIFWFGQAFRIYGTLQQAARSAARAAANPSCTTCAGSVPGQNAATAVQNVLIPANIDTKQLQSPTPPPSFLSCGPGSGNVPCDPVANPNVNICVQPGIQLSSTAGGATAAGVCGVAVSFKYPFKFWFPGTSLNNQQILMEGIAEARSENR